MRTRDVPGRIIVPKSYAFPCQSSSSAAVMLKRIAREGLTGNGQRFITRRAEALVGEPDGSGWDPASRDAWPERL
jgi:hypothetical protein